MARSFKENKLILDVFERITKSCVLLAYSCLPIIFHITHYCVLDILPIWLSGLLPVIYNSRMLQASIRRIFDAPTEKLKICLVHQTQFKS